MKTDGQNTNIFRARPQSALLKTTKELRLQLDSIFYEPRNARSPMELGGANCV